MEHLDYYTVTPQDTEESILKLLDRKYGLRNLFPIAEPLKLGGNAKILVLRTSKGFQTVKIDGPGFIIYKIYNTIVSKRSYNNSIDGK
jgi:hypothetical protein